MEWVRALHGTIVGLDTAPLIYFIEKHPTYLPLLLPFFESVERGEMQVVTSTLTLTEVLVHPYRDGNPDLAERYLQILLHARHLRMIALSPAIAAEAARVRAGPNLHSQALHKMGIMNFNRHCLGPSLS